MKIKAARLMVLVDSAKKKAFEALCSRLGSICFRSCT